MSSSTHSPETKRRSLLLALRIFFVLGFVFTFPLFLLMTQATYQSFRAQTFIETDALIQENRIVSRGDERHLMLRYAYQFNGVPYEGSRYQFGSETLGFNDSSRGSRGQTAALFQKTYPAGETIRIFVNPKNPTEATVSTDYWYTWWEQLAMTLIALGFVTGLFITVFFPKTATRNFTFSDPS